MGGCHTVDIKQSLHMYPDISNERGKHLTAPGMINVSG